MQSLTRFKRVYRCVCEWEEVKHNMWGSVEYAPQALARAIEFTGDHVLYGSYMMRVVSEWEVSCENALTDYSLNRKAWVGAAACALGFQCPEDIVRKAWGYLSDEQRTLANRQAAIAIGDWEDRNRSRLELRGDVGGQVLHLWDTGSITKQARIISSRP